MDEADLLSDRIGVLSAGELLACGSPTFLKHHFGQGFALTVSLRAPRPELRASAPEMSLAISEEPNEHGEAVERAVKGFLECVASHVRDYRVVSYVSFVYTVVPSLDKFFKYNF